MGVHHYSASVSARYAQLGDSTTASEHWYVLHGYRQLAPHFIKKFKSIESPTRCITAPEGPHRFYIEGYSGRVGASWMTKEDRETDISNYCSLLDQLHAHLNFSNDVKQVLLGFSQGAATAVRWFCLGQTIFDALVLWAGSFPKDMDLGLLKECLEDSPLVLVVGSKDEFIKSEHINDVKVLLDGAGISYSFVHFDGGHTIQDTALKEAFKYI
ncbi:MAG: alpha/beta hydrolase [Flavobacteriales bacterium]